MIDTENLNQVLSTDICTPIPEATVSKIISRPPFVTVPGVSNIRDLSHDNGVRPGFVYRSGNLSDVTDEGKSILVGRIGVSTVFDLRNQSEREKAPSPEIEGIKTIWMPYGVRPASLSLRDFAGKDHSAIGFVKMYMGILDSAAPVFCQVFQHVQNCPNDPFIFHCSAGKDRTGVLASLILLLVGRSHNEIITDYILTRVGLENVRENLQQMLDLNLGTDQMQPEVVGYLELSGVRPGAMAAFLKTFEETYDGGVEEYLTEKLGFSRADVEMMRRNLVN
ncbi:hypothetical protein N7510_000061 [Penicillium lagena]|uniref:uncharacterized protein n=1 Tax=Penicillium lagena TaxID=94218 RepID=UPI0025404CD0|nr:uncharacterized protein N7510_000061 [Penicillium lagena]KAJ5623752.1 hypothetical protein N7510_000061 [Penicillium lagena]